MEVSSTVSGNSNNSCDSDQSNEMPSIATVSGVSLNSSSGINLNPPTTLVCVPTVVSVSNAMAQAQNQQSDSVFHLTLASTGNNHIITQRDALKTTIAVSAMRSLVRKKYFCFEKNKKILIFLQQTPTIAKPIIHQQQLHQNINKMQGIVYTNSPSINTIQLQQAQLQTKLQRQSSIPSNPHPLLSRTIQRAQKIHLTHTPPTSISRPVEKYVLFEKIEMKKQKLLKNNGITDPNNFFYFFFKEFKQQPHVIYQFLIELW